MKVVASHILLLVLMSVAVILPISAGNVLRDTVALSERVDFKYDLLNSQTFRFHPVNGVDLQESCSFLVKPDTDIVLAISPRLQYAFLIHALEPGLELSLQIGPKHRFSVEGERELHDWNRTSETEFDWLKNSFSAFIAHKNYVKVVDKRSLSASYTLQYDGRTWISFSYEGYELRNVKNHSTFALFHNGDTYSPNYPDCPAISDVLNLDPCRPLRESNLVFSSQLPFSQRLSSVAMNLIVQYATNAEVFHPEISLSQYIRNSDFNMLYWRVNYGFFSGDNPERLSFHEWKHFQASQRFFPMRSEETGVVGFVALDPYVLSTNDWHVDASFRMFREKLLLLHIPNLRPLFIKGEALSLTAAYTKQQGKVYSEVGYELLNVLDAIHVGVYASFSNAHYQSLHFKMGVTPPKMTFRQAVKNIRIM